MGPASATLIIGKPTNKTKSASASRDPSLFFFFFFSLYFYFLIRNENKPPACCIFPGLPQPGRCSRVEKGATLSKARLSETQNGLLPFQNKITGFAHQIICRRHQAIGNEGQMKGGNVLVLSHSLISNTPSSSNDFESTYRQSPSVLLPPWKDQPGEAAQGHPGGKCPPKSPGSPPPAAAPAPCRPAGMAWDGMEWDKMGWDGMAALWPPRSLILYFHAGSQRCRGSGEVMGPGRWRWEPRCGQHTGTTKGSGGRKAPAEVLGEGSRDRPGERAGGPGARWAARETRWARPGSPESSWPRRKDGNNKQTGKDVRLRWSGGRGAAVRCSRRHRSRALANSFFFFFFFLFCSAPQVVF